MIRNQIRLTDDEVWYWYCTIKTFNVDGRGTKKICRDYGIDYDRYVYMKQSIVYCEFTQPDLYKERINHVECMLKDDIPITKYCAIHKLNKPIMTQALTHYRYKEILNRLKSERGEPVHISAESVSKLLGKTLATKKNEPKEQRITFTNISSTPRPPIEPEVMTKKNDIEIIIQAGIKVSISPNVDAMKIVKIIELLKDL